MSCLNSLALVIGKLRCPGIVTDNFPVNLSWLYLVICTAGGTASSSLSPVGLISRQERRHDSGSDSGTELADDAILHGLSTSPAGGGEAASKPASVESENVPQLLFELLEKTFSLIICKQVDDRDRDRVVAQFFRLVERRCLRREAFTGHHKQWFHTWLKRMDQVWEITKNQEVAMEKRKFERK